MTRESLILDAAERLFDEHGYAGVGVDLIGREAGVSGSAIYRHFSGKDEILATLFDRTIDALLMGAGPDRSDSDADLEHLIERAVDFALENPRLATIWGREERALSVKYRRIYGRRKRQYLARWDRTLRRCYPHHDREDLVTVRLALLGLLLSTAQVPSRRHAPPGKTILMSMALSSLSALVREPVSA